VGPAQTGTRYYCDSTTIKVIFTLTILSLLRAEGGSQEWVGPAQTGTRYYCDSTTIKVIFAMTILSLLRVGGGSQEWVQLRLGLDTIVIPLPSR
jgi:hypothetical protein